MAEPLRAVITGAQGRMGRAILHLLGEDETIKPVQLIDRDGSFEPGAMIGVGRWDAIELRGDLSHVPFDVLIDFSAPEASLQFLEACATAQKPMVIGTTGFTDEEQACSSSVNPVVPITIGFCAVAHASRNWRLASGAEKSISTSNGT